MLSNYIQIIGASPTLRINAKVRQMKREGIDIIDLSLGEPDFPTPPNVMEAAKRAIDDGHTKYTSNVGVLELRQAIVDKYLRECSAVYSPENVIVSTGAKQALFNACTALLNKGDEVIIPAPYWVSYPQMVTLARGNPVIVPTKEENGFRLTSDELGRAITARTKAIIINNPSNPTGSGYSPEDLLKVIDVCMDEGLLIIADEIYEKMVYGGFQFKSVAAFGEKVQQNSLIISGFSKAYAMTGWRIGYTVGPAPIIMGMEKIQSHTTSNANSIAQWAAVEALNGPQTQIKVMCERFEERRNAALEMINDIPHCSCYEPEGAFYLFPNFSWYYDKQYKDMPIRNSAGLAYYLLKYAKIALIPGEAFGADNFIRISYSTSTENVKEGMRRIKEALAQLKPTLLSIKTPLINSQTRVREYTKVDLISVKESAELVKEAEAVMPFDNFHEWNVVISGVVLKLITNSPHLIDFWMNNLFPAPADSDEAPDGIIYAVMDVPNRKPSTFYCSDNHNAIMFNTAYYPQLRSLMFGMIDEITTSTLETFFVAGSSVTVEDKGICLIGPPASGVTTHLAGLLSRPEVKLNSINGFTVTQQNGSPVAESLERKFLIRTNIVKGMPELASLFDRSKLENVITNKEDCPTESCSIRNDCMLDEGKLGCYIASRYSFGLLDPLWIGGREKYRKRVSISKLILFLRDPAAPKIIRLEKDDALRRLEDGVHYSDRGGLLSTPFFNFHRLVNDRIHVQHLVSQWKKLLLNVPAYLINTGRLSKAEAQVAIWEIVRQN